MWGFIVLGLLSAHFKRLSVSRMQDLKKNIYILCQIKLLQSCMYVLTSIRELNTSSEHCVDRCVQTHGVRMCGGADGRRQLAVRRDKDGGHVRQHTRGGAGGAGAAGPGGGGGGGEGGQNTPASELLSGRV